MDCKSKVSQTGIEPAPAVTETAMQTITPLRNRERSELRKVAQSPGQDSNPVFLSPKQAR